MSDLKALVGQLDEKTAKGEILEALGEFYAEDCTFSEAADGSRRTGRANQHDFLSQFFASLKGFNGARLHSHGVGDDVTLSEFTFDMTAGDGSSLVWNEVLVRRWRDGKVVAETFYNASA